MTNPFETARNASAGMPGHSMSADVGVREAGGDKLREALEELRGCMIRHPTPTCEVRKEYLEVVLEVLGAALNPPTESVKAPEGKITQQEMVELFGSEMPIEAATVLWSAPPDWTISQVRAEVRRIAVDKATPITADDAVAKERERCARIADKINAQAKCLEAYAESNGFSGKAPASVFHWQATHFRDLAAELRRSLSPDTEGEGM